MSSWNQVLSGGIFPYHCGPFNSLIKNKKSRDSFDEACRQHDLAYKKMGWKKAIVRHNWADDAFLKRIKNLPGIAPSVARAYFNWKKRNMYSLPSNKRKAIITNSIVKRHKGPWGYHSKRVYGGAFDICPNPYSKNYFKPKKIRGGIKGNFGTTNMPYYKKKRFSRRKRKRWSKRKKTSIPYGVLAKAIAPIQTVKGLAYHKFEGSPNAQNFISYERGGSGGYDVMVHGSSERFVQVFRSAYKTTTNSDFEGANVLYWPLSKTTYTVTNPTNATIKVKLFETMQNIKHEVNGPLYAFSVHGNNLGNFPSDSININTDIGWNYNPPVAAKPFATAVCDVAGGLTFSKKAASHMKVWNTYYKIIKQRNYTLGPGQSFTYTQRSRYGKIVGEMFQSTTIHRTPRNIFMEVTGQTVAGAAGQTVGVASPALTIKVTTLDLVRKLDTDNTSTFNLVTDSGAGANRGPMDQPTATTVNVPATLSNPALDIS